MYKKVNESIDCEKNKIIEGDTVEIISHRFLSKKEIGVQGVITNMQHYFQHHSGCADDRGEGWDEEFSSITFRTKEQKTYSMDGCYLRKIPKII